MNGILYILFLSIFTVDYLAAEIPAIPRLVTWLPEVIAAVLLLMVAMRIASTSRLDIHPKYVMWALFMMMLIAIGVIINDVQAGSIFYGIRKYMRYIPVFLVGLVYRFSEREIVGQLKFLLFLALCQLPVAIYQRLFDFPTLLSPDVVKGTVGTSSQLTVFLLSALAMLTAFYVKGRIRFPHYVVIASTLTLPTWFNETTSTALLLPLAIGTPFVLSLISGSVEAKRRMVPIAIVSGILVSGFAITYSIQFQRWGEGGLSNALGRGGMDFLYRGATEESEDYGKMREIGRIDSIVLPLRVLDDPVQWVVGVGIGNASDTFSNLFMGEYSRIAERYGADFTTLSSMMWEIGIVGVLLTFTFMYFVFSDSRFLATRNDIPGVFALGWTGVVLVLIAAFFYKNLIDNNVNGFLMWLLCGYVVGWRALPSANTTEKLTQVSPDHSAGQVGRGVA